MRNQRCPACQENGHDTGNDEGHLYLMRDGLKWCCTHSEYHTSKAPFFVTSGEDGLPVGVAGGPGVADGPSDGLDKPVEHQDENPFETTDSPRRSLDSSFGGNPARFRGIDKETYEVYGCRMEFNEADLSVEKVFYPMFSDGLKVAYKVRHTKDKKFFKLEVNE